MRCGSAAMRPWLIRIGAGTRSHLGVGAFNLVQSDAFRAIGGFEHLALSVDDDNRLAQALKAAGFQGRALLGSGAVSVRWHSGVNGLTRGLEKNLFALIDYRLSAMTLLCSAWLACRSRKPRRSEQKSDMGSTRRSRHLLHTKKPVVERLDYRLL